MALSTHVQIVRPDFDSDGGRRTPDIRDFVSVPLMTLRGTWKVMDTISAESLAALAVLANRLEGGTKHPTASRFRKASKPVTVRHSASRSSLAEAQHAFHDWSVGSRREIRNAAQ